MADDGGAIGAAENRRHPVRLFYALVPAETEKIQIQAQQAKLRAVAQSGRDTTTENLHMTLQFLGESLPERVEALKKILTAVARENSPFSVTLDAYGSFAGRGRERLWYLTGNSPEAAAIARSLGELLEENGFAVEQRAFVPHITLARRCQLKDGTIPEAATPVNIRVQRLWLMESRRIRGSTVYVPVFHAGLL